MQSCVAEATCYFAYGSNMNAERVRQRHMGFHAVQGGWLADYQLVFNKRSQKHPGAASANVVYRKGSRTEGVVYRLKGADQITVMDPFEGYPARYDRIILPVSIGQSAGPGAQEQAWVYMANPAWVTGGLSPARWYLEHLLAGRPYLSPGYIETLMTTPCLPDSLLEPEG